MNEEVKVNESTEQVNEAEKKPAERMYTQKEYDEGIKKANGNVMRRVEKLTRELEQSKNSENVARLVAESIGFDGPADELFDVVAKHYGKDGKETLEKYQNGDLSKRETEVRLETLEFLNADDTTDEDIVAEFERISEKPKSKQTAADRIKMDLMAKRYYKIVSKGHIRNAESWYKKNVGDDFDTFVGNEEFSEFVKGLNIPFDEAVKKYCKIKGLKKAEEPKKEKLSSGSAKDFGGGFTPEYLTQEQVAKMSREEVRENYDLIKKSEKRWYKKG